MDVIRRYVFSEDPSLLFMAVLAELRNAAVQDVADVLWALDVELNNSEPPAAPAVTTRLLEIIKGYVEASPQDRYEIVCESVELDTLGQCGLVDLDSARKSLRKKNTFLRFRQTKFNLIREESEGYAKLLTELLGDASFDVVIRNSLSLIGYFRLDPNRVFDLILDSLYHSPDRLFRICSEMFVEPSSSIGKLEDLLSFKLSRMSKVKSATARKNTLKSIGYLLAEGICKSQSVIPHLHLQSFVVDCAKTDEEIAPSKQKDEQLTSLLAQTFDGVEAQLIVELITTTLELEKGWPCSLELLDSVKRLERHVFRNPDACKALHSFLDKEMAAVYSQHCHAAGAIKQTPPAVSQLGIRTLEDFADRFIPLLQRFGPETVSAAVTKDSSLLHRVVRLCGKLFDVVVAHNKNASGDEQKGSAVPLIDGLLVQCILPAITLLPSSNPVIAQELWSGVLSKMDSTRRFALYERWREVTERRPIRPELVAMGKIHLDQVNFALKRFCSDMERNLVPARKFAKVAHVNPFCAFQNALRISDNLIPFLVHSLDFCTKLELDVLGFLFCDVLVQTQQSKIKSDLTNDALWFSATCQLIGESFSKCPDMDLSPLLELVFDRCVRKNDIMFLRVLEVLLTRTSMMDIVSDYSKALLESSGGGDTLRLVAFCAFSIAPQRRSKFQSFANGQRDTSVMRLRKLLEDESHGPFFIKFLMAMAFQRKKTLFETKLAFPNEPKKSLKLKSLLYDQLSAIFFQLSYFVLGEMDTAKIAKHLPPLKELGRTFRMEPAIALHLHRLVLSPRKRAEPGRFHPEEFMKLFPASSSPTGDDDSVQDLFGRFFELSLYDINLPKAQYEAERNQLETMKRELERESGATLVVRKMVNKTRDLSVTLKNEMATQMMRVEAVHKVLAESKPKWRETLVKNDSLLTEFFQQCLVPRLFLSPEDAYYSARFLCLGVLSVDIKSPSQQQKDIPLNNPHHHRELDELDRKLMDLVFSSLVSLLQTSTERETEYLGIFLVEMLQWLDSFMPISEEEDETKKGADEATKSESVLVNGKQDGEQLDTVSRIAKWKSDLADRLVVALTQSTAGSSLAFQALTLLSSLKEVFPDTEPIAKRLQPVLMRFATEEPTTTEEENGAADDADDGFDVAEKAVLKGKANSLLGAIKKRRDLRKLRLANGRFPPAPAISEEQQPPPQQQQQQPFRSQPPPQQQQQQQPFRSQPPLQQQQQQPTRMVPANVAMNTLMQSQQKSGGGSGIASLLGKTGASAPGAAASSTVLKPIPSLKTSTTNNNTTASAPTTAAASVLTASLKPLLLNNNSQSQPVQNKPSQLIPVGSSSTTTTAITTTTATTKPNGIPSSTQPPPPLQKQQQPQKKPLLQQQQGKMQSLLPSSSQQQQQQQASSSLRSEQQPSKPSSQQPPPAAAKEQTRAAKQQQPSQQQQKQPPQQQPTTTKSATDNPSSSSATAQLQKTQQKDEPAAAAATEEKQPRQPSRGRNKRTRGRTQSTGDADEQQRPSSASEPPRQQQQRPDSRGPGEAGDASRGNKRTATESTAELEAKSRGGGNRGQQQQQRPSSALRSPPRRTNTAVDVVSSTRPLPRTQGGGEPADRATGNMRNRSRGGRQGEERRGGDDRDRRGEERDRRGGGGGDDRDKRGGDDRDYRRDPDREPRRGEGDRDRRGTAPDRDDDRRGDDRRDDARRDDRGQSQGHRNRSPKRVRDDGGGGGGGGGSGGDSKRRRY